MEHDVMSKLRLFRFNIIRLVSKNNISVSPLNNLSQEMLRILWGG